MARLCLLNLAATRAHGLADVAAHGAGVGLGALAANREMLAMAKAIVANLNKSAEATWDSFSAFTDESNHMVLQ